MYEREREIERNNERIHIYNVAIEFVYIRIQLNVIKNNSA